MTESKLIYMPMGGAGEIGMNMYLYGYGPVGDERFILVDLGVTFPNAEQTPGVDLIMADCDWIAARADRLDGIFITHAHEDHIGALGVLFDRLNAPIYCRKFTAHVARAKMEERGQDPMRVQVVPAYPHTQSAGPFQVAMVPVSHSIPEASALLIQVAGQRVFHSGDFKLDPSPIVGEAYDPALFKQIGRDGVDVLVCDSTNVFTDHAGRSESSLPDQITALLKDAPGMVVATTFASNIARLKTLAQAGVDAGRAVCVMGRSMQRMLGYAQASGVLDDFPPLISVEDATSVPRDQLMLLVTGSQGEGRAASAQLARGSFLGMSLSAGDIFLFSSKTIPGNEVGVARIINDLVKQGVRVIDDSVAGYHVSGHANRPDLIQIHNVLDPKLIIPMHGEYRHLAEHVALAHAGGRDALLAPNGSLVEIDSDGARIADHISISRRYLDGKRLIGAMDGIVRDRIRMATRGVVAVSVVLDDDDLLEIWAEPIGLPDSANDHTPLADQIEDEIESAFARATPKRMRDDREVEGVITRATNAVCRTEIGKKPLVRVLINRVEE